MAAMEETLKTPLPTLDRGNYKLWLITIQAVAEEHGLT